MQYGSSPQQLHTSAQKSSNGSLITLALNMDGQKRTDHYYYIVSASNNTYMARVEGTLSIGGGTVNTPSGTDDLTIGE